MEDISNDSLETYVPSGYYYKNENLTIIKNDEGIVPIPETLEESLNKISKDKINLFYKFVTEKIIKSAKSGKTKCSIKNKIYQFGELFTLNKNEISDFIVLLEKEFVKIKYSFGSFKIIW